MRVYFGFSLVENFVLLCMMCMSKMVYTVMDHCRRCDCVCKEQKLIALNFVSCCTFLFFACYNVICDLLQYRHMDHSKHVKKILYFCHILVFNSIIFLSDCHRHGRRANHNSTKAARASSWFVS